MRVYDSNLELMKKYLFLLVAICSCLCAVAQKPVVVVDHFTSASCKKADLINLRNHVIAGIYETGNVNLIDLEAESTTLSIEANRRSSEYALADPTARIGEMKTLGANYVITGDASKIGADKKRTDYYTGNVVFTLKVVNTEDGTIVGAEAYQYSDIQGGSGSTADKAVYETLGKVKREMAVFVSKYFKAKGTIVEFGDMKNGKPKSCYINLGSTYGLAAGQELLVYEVKMIAGYQAQEVVGSIKVENIVAEGLSKCKITEGVNEILNAFQAGHEIIIEEKEKKQAERNAAEAGRDAVEVGRKAVQAGKDISKVGKDISKLVKLLK